MAEQDAPGFGIQGGSWGQWPVGSEVDGETA